MGPHHFGREDDRRLLQSLKLLHGIRHLLHETLQYIRAKRQVIAALALLERAHHRALEVCIERHDTHRAILAIHSRDRPLESNPHLLDERIDILHRKTGLCHDIDHRLDDRLEILDGHAFL